MPKAAGSARRARIEQRRSQILSAAAAVFARKGYERATIADIAREASVAEGSIYNYFKNKGDLLVSLPRQMIQPKVEASSAQISVTEANPSLGPEQALEVVARTMLETIRQNAPLIRVLLSALPSLKPAARQKYLQTVVVYATEMLEDYFRRQAEAGLLRANLDPRIAARAFIGMFFPFVMLQDVLEIEGEPAYDPEKLVHDIVSLFLRGGLAGPGSPEQGRAPAHRGTRE